MKGYKTFIIIFSVLFILYIIAELNKPKPLDWTVSISKTDKNPYGGFILYNQLTSIFPQTAVQSYRTPVYDQVHNFRETNTAYFIIGPVFKPSVNDLAALKKYVRKGNYVLASADMFYQPFLDSFGVETAASMSLKLSDSSGVNFVNPALKTPRNYTFPKAAIGQFFSKIDTAKTVILCTNNKEKPVYIKIPFGKGAFFLHADPISFSNYFLLFNNNASYTSKALSYIPANVSKIYWDEFYKSGPEGATTPLRFFLSDEYLRWSIRLALITLLLYIFFEMKRRQRIIPVITPLANSTLDFVKTVAGVHFNEKNNHVIAVKKISHFLENIRSRFYITAHIPDEDFAGQLHRKSGVDKEQVADLVNLLATLPAQTDVTDTMLMNLDRSIDNFNKKV